MKFAMTETRKTKSARKMPEAAIVAATSVAAGPSTNTSNIKIT